MRASASRANSRPITAASTSIRSHSAERWVSRRAMTSRMLWGMASRASAVDSGADALDGQEAHDLADEERIPLGLRVQPGHQLRRGDLRRRQFDVLRDLALAQPAKREAAGHRLAGDFGQHLGQRSSGDGVDVPVGAEEQDAGRAKLAGEEPQQEKRGRVGRVQVVQEEHEGPTLGGAPEELGGSVEKSEARPFGLEGRAAPADRGSAGAARGRSGRARRRLHRAASAGRCRRCPARVRAATAPRASRRGRRPPPSSGRRGPAPRAPWRGARAPRRGGSCRCRARRRAGIGGRGRRTHRRVPADQLGQFALAAHERAALVLHRRLGSGRLLRRGQVQCRVLREYRPLELA